MTLRVQVSSREIRVSGLGFRVSGFGFRVRCCATIFGTTCQKWCQDRRTTFAGFRFLVSPFGVGGFEFGVLDKSSAFGYVSDLFFDICSCIAVHLFRVSGFWFAFRIGGFEFRV